MDIFNTTVSSHSVGSYAWNFCCCISGQVHGETCAEGSALLAKGRNILQSVAEGVMRNPPQPEGPFTSSRSDSDQQGYPRGQDDETIT